MARSQTAAVLLLTALCHTYQCTASVTTPARLSRSTTTTKTTTITTTSTKPPTTTTKPTLHPTDSQTLSQPSRSGTASATRVSLIPSGSTDSTSKTFSPDNGTGKSSASTAASLENSSSSTFTPPRSWLGILPEGMDWILLGVLLFLILLALSIVICLLWSNKERQPSSCAKFLGVPRPDSVTDVEEGAGEQGSPTHAPAAAAAAANPPADPPTRPVIVVKPLTNPQNHHHLPSDPPDAPHSSDPSPSSSDPARPIPTRRRALQRSPKGPRSEETGATSEEKPGEEEGGGGAMGSKTKSLYSVLRQSLAQLDPVQSYLVDRLEFGQLDDDFKGIPVSIVSLSHDQADRPENKNKNRFASVVPYDQNRVVLKDSYTEGEATDYVNASYINGHRQEKAYIAAQGPKDTTASDFWRMIWQEKVTHIVMLTNLKERGRDKCHQYWPEGRGETVRWGPTSITLDSLESRATFLIRRFTLTCTLSDNDYCNTDSQESSEKRGVTQLHYISWPDFGVPQTASLVSFWRYVSKMRRQEAAEEFPLVVHCSAGVGRSGTFIGLDIAMKQAVAEGKVDLLQLVTSLRHQRVLMVQAAAQFEFFHMALLEAYTSRESIIPTDEIDAVFASPVLAREPNARIDMEFGLLTEMKALACEMTCRIAKQDANRGKNRNLKFLPADDHIVHLTEYVAGRGEYINAVFMPTFHESRGSVVTQLPLPSTMVDFWRLVYGENISTILSLSCPSEESDIDPPCQFWPLEKGGVMEVPPYTLSLQSVTTVSPSLLSYTLCMNKQKVSKSRELILLHYQGWSGETAGDVDDVMNVVDNLMTLSSTETYLIQCTDGVQKSGLFCALCDVIGRMTYDDEIDIYMSVRHIQSVSPQAVSSVVQYRYLYEAAQQRSSQLNVYVNEI